MSYFNTLLLDISLTLLLFISFSSCKDNIVDPGFTANSICYEKLNENHWQIFTNNISGTNPLNISNYLKNDEYPQWSSGGRYIVFKRSVDIYGPLVYTYDLKTNTYINLMSDGGLSGDWNPKWAPNGKVYFAYQRPIGSPTATYIMNPDGSNKKKILDSAAIIYFYEDSYNFIYIVGSKVYKTNIDNTTNEFIIDLEPGGDKFLTIRDFNSLTAELLVNTNTIPGITSAIAKYNIESRHLDLIFSAEEGFIVAGQKYSKNYSKIVFIEINTNGYEEEYLSLFEKGEKRRLIKLSGDERFDYNPMEFSYDGRYVAFSKNVKQSADLYWWKSYLYVVNTITGELHYIDEGICPSWNPYQ